MLRRTPAVPVLRELDVSVFGLARRSGQGRTAGRRLQRLGGFALYRSLVAGQRILVLLDNASQADQVRPLLPGGAGCVAIVTSRNDLLGLAATDDAWLLPLDVFSAAEARELLRLRRPADYTSGAPAGAKEGDPEGAPADQLIDPARASRSRWLSCWPAPMPSRADRWPAWSTSSAPAPSDWTP